MEFKHAKEYIDNLSKYGSVLGLDNIKMLMDYLGNPQNKLKVIHVAGTNGKGSTIAFLSQILIEAGYKVGKYTSPAVFEYLEKYQINNINMPEEEYGKIIAKVKWAADEMVSDKKGQPTVFEVETAVAFEYFKESECDIAIIETGMGGDMDATNVIKHVLASVIVSISLDHTGFLGNTLEEIAGHKAGIIKKDCPVVVSNKNAAVINVIDEYAVRLNATVTVASTLKESDGVFSYITSNGTSYEDIRLGLKGEWQSENAAIAIEVIDILNKKGYKVNKEAAKMGLANTKWPGRFEMISKNPCIIIDGAHNPGAAEELINTLDSEYEDTSFVYIMGVLADKDFSEVIKLTAKRAVKIITVTPDNPRACNAKVLRDEVSLYNENVVAADTVEEALDMAISEYDNVKGQKAILAFGSLSYLGALKNAWKERCKHSEDRQ